MIPVGPPLRVGLPVPTATLPGTGARKRGEHVDPPGPVGHAAGGRNGMTEVVRATRAPESAAARKAPSSPPPTRGRTPAPRSRSGRLRRPFLGVLQADAPRA